MILCVCSIVAGCRIAQEKIRAALPELQQIFLSLDADGSGHVTRAEAANVPLTVSFRQPVQLLPVGSSTFLILQGFLLWPDFPDAVSTD